MLDKKEGVFSSPVREMPKGMVKYESLLKIICNTEDLRVLPQNEWEGCIGCACIMAVLEGVRPSLFELGKHLNIPFTSQELEAPFDRLRINGVFGAKYDLRSDKALKGMAKGNKYRTDSEIHLNAWCMMAGIAGGIIGLN